MTVDGKPAERENSSKELTSREMVSVQSVLDPHLSVLELLEKSYNSITDRGGLQPPILNFNEELTESWHAIQRQEYAGTPSQGNGIGLNAVGILSSSDTSEEEMERGNTPASFNGWKQATMVSNVGNSGLRTVGTNDSFQTPATTDMVSYINGSTVDDDNATVTRSLTSSSNSFIMPKLSLSRKGEYNDVFKFLILGRGGSKFYQLIPRRYQDLFQLPRTHDIDEYAHFTGLLIIVQELRELMSLLNRISTNAKGKPIVAICEPDQRIQVKNIIKPFVKKKFVTLLHQPISGKNDKEIEKMFEYLRGMSIEFESQLQSDEKSSSCLSSISKCNSLSSGKKKKLTKRKERRAKNSKKDWRYRKWIFWGVSITVGVGVGYFISFFISSSWCTIPTSFIAKHCFSAKKETMSVEPAKHGHFFFLINNEPGKNSSNVFRHYASLIKVSLKKLNSIIKESFLKPIYNHTKINGWLSDDVEPLLTINYITV